jgi:hypothetical protein
MRAEASLVASLQQLRPLGPGAFHPAFKKLAAQLHGEGPFAGKVPLIFTVPRVFRFSRFKSNSYMLTRENHHRFESDFFANSKVSGQLWASYRSTRELSPEKREKITEKCPKPSEQEILPSHLQTGFHRDSEASPCPSHSLIPRNCDDQETALPYPLRPRA